MQSLMFIKMQCACIIILVFISVQYKNSRKLPILSTRLFRMLFITAAVNLVFDAITALMINTPQLRDLYFNRIAHVVFIGSINLFVFLLCIYICSLIPIKHIFSHTKNIIRLTPFALSMSILIASLFDDKYLTYNTEHLICYSEGISANTVYFSIAIYIVMNVYYLIRYNNIIDKRQSKALAPSLFVMVATSTMQMLNPQLLMSGLGITLIITGLYASIEDSNSVYNSTMDMINVDGFKRVYIDNQIRNNNSRLVLLSIYRAPPSNPLNNAEKEKLFFNISKKINSLYHLYAFDIYESHPIIWVSANVNIDKLQDSVNTVANQMFDNVSVSLQCIPNEICVPDVDSVIDSIQKIIDEQENNMAIYDIMTGVKNKNAFINDMVKYERPGVEKENLWVVMVDVNRLKFINDTLGHLYGDKAIVYIASSLKRAFTQTNDIYRIGGDEFVIILKDTNEENIKIQLNDVNIFIKQQSEKDEFYPSFSAGIVRYDKVFDEKFSDTIKRADAQMYEQKGKFSEFIKSDRNEQKESDDLDNEFVQLIESLNLVPNFKFLIFDAKKSFVYSSDALTKSTGVISQNSKKFYLDMYSILKTEESQDGIDALYDVLRGNSKKNKTTISLFNTKKEIESYNLFIQSITDYTKKLKYCIISFTQSENDSAYNSNLLVTQSNQFEKRIMEYLNVQKACSVIKIEIQDYWHSFELLNNERLQKWNAYMAKIISNELSDTDHIFIMHNFKFFIITNSTNRKAISALINCINEKLHTESSNYGYPPFRVCAAFLSCPVDESTLNGIHHSLAVQMECALNNHIDTDQIISYSSTLLKSINKSTKMIAALHKSVEDGFKDFEIYYQPIVNSITKKVIGAESLLRWNTSEFSYVGPDDFVPLLEKSGLIIPVGKWIIKNVMSKTVQWCKINPKFFVNINVSYNQFQDKSFVPFLIKQINQNRFEYNNITLELTESCRVKDITVLSSQFEILRNNGYKIALDDFGTGYATFETLQNVHSDMLKLDRSFIAKSINSKTSKIVIDGIMRMCKQLNMGICIEGIESEEMIRKLKMSRNNIYYQGYLFGCPCCINDFESLYFK